MISVFCAGRIGQDLELKKTKSDMAVLNLSVGSTTKYGGNEITSWMKVVAWGKQAEAIAQFFKKGDQIIISGSGANKKWQKDDGSEGLTFEVNVNSWAFGAKSKVNEEAEMKTPPKARAPLPNDLPAESEIPF